MSLKLTWHNHADDLPADLWERGFAPPLEGVWWYRALEQSHLEAQFCFLYALVSDVRDEPVAIAPCFVMRVPLEMFVPRPLVRIVRVLGTFFPRLLHQRTLFVGSPCSDRGWVGMRPQADRLAVLRCVQDGVNAKARELDAPMRVWKDFPEEFEDDLRSLAREQDMFRVVSFPGTEVRLNGGRKDDYLNSLQGTKRQRLVRNVRRSVLEVDLERSIERSPDTDTLDEIYWLFQQTYERSTTKFERLNRRFFDHIASAPASLFILLRHPTDRRLVAFMLCFDLGPTLVNKFVGFDYGRPREWRLYFRLWDAFIDLAVGLTKDSVESGQTGYGGKLAIGHRLLPLANYCHHTNPLLRRIYRTVSSQVSWQSIDAELAQYLARASDVGRRPGVAEGGSSIRGAPSDASSVPDWPKRNTRARPPIGTAERIPIANRVS